MFKATKFKRGIRIKKNSGGKMPVLFPYNSDYISKVKSIKGYRWHPEEKCWSFQEQLGHKSSKTTEIYTHVSTKNLGKIKSPLDSLKLNGWMKNDKIC